ncbi:gamma carbonic anhydrase family protein [Deinococcus metallilatus]|uniref:Carbonic anhydrase/acetyltransferase-like protein (Isoleucine patch superfamily) n=1 Tax=Deinococcus metallilatus TaxID=1211322 RepID=A0ABR6MN56_9DEIO|nr:gamma carbonic anhydrase family protein [Deinococcus metallilatus]MBB5293374.1 carbonic anhydrase/acetyltransferase-like protein (isoleucine patch superfamily) [Deinococcus metallilatus]GMA15403.1 gamma carbonic anhydrase family protein [Deinococcus metallilatus]
MVLLIPFGGHSPRVGRDVFLAPTAVLIGNVTVEEGASVWFGAVLRGDFGAITIGAGSSVQDNVVVHTGADCPTLIGRNVTIGHNATVEGCAIGDGALIGVGAVVLPYAVIGAGSLVAANSVVLERTEIPEGVLVTGAPAKVKGPLQGRARDWTGFAARDYHAMQARYRAEGVDRFAEQPADAHS